MVLSLNSACVGHIRGSELSRGAIFELVFLPTPASFACFADTIGFKSPKKIRTPLWIQEEDRRVEWSFFILVKVDMANITICKSEKNFTVVWEFKFLLAMVIS